VETDYLVVGAGAAGMAFTDALIDASRADVLIVDRRHAPGGHWLEAYPFVRLHQPSSYYGVDSTPLGGDTIGRDGMYERATAAEIAGYYDRVMQQRLLPSGQVRYLPMASYSDGTIVSRVSGEVIDVKVRRAVVDTTYLEGRFPASSPPPFEVASGVRCVPVGELASLKEAPDGYVILGAGKTAHDAITWLLETGVAPSAIRWIKPRDPWFLNRTYAQGGELVGDLIEGLARQNEAAAAATSIDDLFARLEGAEQLLRVDPTVTPTMYRGPTISTQEIEQLRRVEDVVRLGKVRRIEQHRIVLDRGEVPTSPRHLHVHCAAVGLADAPAVPIFGVDRITIQSIRIGLLPFAAAITAYVEATRGDDLAAKNRLCPPNPQPCVPLDWLRGNRISMTADYLWSKEPDVAEWLDRSRLNATRGLRARAGDPTIRRALARYGAAARPALANLERLAASA
jgi:hypothetical protein